MNVPKPRALNVVSPLALLLVAILALTARADPVRLGERELRSVIVDGRFGSQARRATDWLRGTAWLDLATPLLRLPLFLELHTSRPSFPQTVRRFEFGQSTGDGTAASTALWLHLPLSALSATE